MSAVEVREWHGMLGLFATSTIAPDNVITLYPSSPPTTGAHNPNSHYVVEIDMINSDVPTFSSLDARPVEGRAKKRLALRPIATRGTVDGNAVATAHRDPRMINGSTVPVHVYDTRSGRMVDSTLGDALGVYANQSIFPNAILYNPGVTAAPNSETRLCLVSSAPIVPQAQIAIDYGAAFPPTWLPGGQQKLIEHTRTVIDSKATSVYRMGSAVQHNLTIPGMFAGMLATNVSVVALHPTGKQTSSFTVEPPAGKPMLIVGVSESPDGRCNLEFEPNPIENTNPPDAVLAWLESVGNPKHVWTRTKANVIATFRAGDLPVGFMVVKQASYFDGAA